MLSNKITSLIEQGHEKKKSQMYYGIGALLIALILSIVLWKKQHTYGASWTLGIGIGIVLRYSRFCFASAFRDPFLVGNTKLLRGMLVAMMISTVGFALIQSSYINENPINYDLIPGAITSVGFHVMIGAFLFGIGMVIAGGCSSGVLMRIGEGHALHWIVFLGFLIGTLLGAKDYSFWHKWIIEESKVVYFPEYIDFKIVVVLQIGVLIILYRLVLWYEKKYWKGI